MFEGSLTAGYVEDALFLLLLAVAAHAVEENRFIKWTPFLRALSFVGVIVCFFWDQAFILFIVSWLYMAYLGLVTIQIAVDVARDRRISADSVFGGLCVYVLLGVFWFVCFSTLHLMSPGAFDFGVHGADPDMTVAQPLLYYFSLVTLMTIGYGDVVPTSHMAQTLAILEGLMGHFISYFSWPLWWADMLPDTRVNNRVQGLVRSLVTDG